MEGCVCSVCRGSHRSENSTVLGLECGEPSQQGETAEKEFEEASHSVVEERTTGGGGEAGQVLSRTRGYRESKGAGGFSMKADDAAGQKRNGSKQLS